MRDGACPPDAPSPPSAFATLSMRTPSTTMIGSLRSERLVAPRIRMRDPVPVVPPLCITSTPGTWELSRSVAFTGAASWAILAASMLPTLLPSSRFSCSCPVADTTTASSGTAAGVRAKSAVAVSPAATLTEAVPVA